MEIEKDEAYWEQRARSENELTPLTNWYEMMARNSLRSQKFKRKPRSILKICLHRKGLFIRRKFWKGLKEVFQVREEEVRIALKGMRPTMAPGPDGFPAMFFQKYWHIVGKEVLRYYLGVLNKGLEVDSANTTNIVLIPKIPKPTSLVNFRPISLCTVLYKIVAKTIANRLQDVMGTCIDEVQSAFVPGRLISDNILLANEILHTYRQKRTGKKGYIAVKLDMSKAYDRVEWDFIKAVMNKKGFARSWVELVMKCIKSVSYTVSINGNRGRVFEPSRGLRQGDPLSHFLFLICSEGLSALLRSAKKSGLIKGAKASRKGPEISHLLFADDCMMFGEATEEGARVLKDILKVYENCLGQCVNFGKSTGFL
ncbi:reverse transcriptase [Gossypium australe]|uniref:Reverse transcriptase n=1 Tax=Gossypium australe TaxID=47621 RepID=A0A5B6W1Y3_9ROSI|nr:reverse transcriptase [Gossypium australe]